MKRLIINADDFGWDADTVETTIALIERGWVTSASIMIGQPASTLAIDYAARAGGHVSFGLHFNIVDGGRPASARSQSLCDQRGNFRPSHFQRIAALAGCIAAQDVAAELRAQLSALHAGGVVVSHVDSHGHLHKYPKIIRSMAAVLGEFGIAKVRRPQNVYRAWSAADVMDRYCDRHFPKSLRTTDHFYALDHRHADWMAGLPSLLPDGLNELSIHPGRVDEWRWFETQPLLQTSPTSLKARGVALMNYNEF